MTIALIVILVIIVLYVIITYNKFVTLKKQMKNSYSVIDVYLKKRFDLIPNLVEVTKGYADYEQDVLTKITEYRTAYNQNKDKDALNKLNEQYNNLILVVENYPDLKASESFAQLQEELRNTENKIAYSRQFYNDTVTMYNTKLEMFPSNLIAKAFNFKPSELFEVEDEKEKQNIKIDFSK